MKRKVCMITGSRADYGILYPVMKAIEGSPHLQLYIIATCMHLMKEFGYTIKQIESDGFSIYEKININYKKDTGEAMAFSVGRAISLFSKSFKRLTPDIVVLLGDRGEMLAAAIAANYMNIPVAHIHGGEVSGHVDGIFRHAITKLSHIHLPATQKAKNRLLKLGEEPWRIFVVGAPALDRILNNRITKKEKLIKKYRLNRNQPLGILVQHPVHTQVDQAKRQINVTLKAIASLKLPTIIIYPNADAGGKRMIEELKQYRRFQFFKHFKNIPHQDYLGLLAFADILIGNSSSGIIEASSFGLPVVNIGSRQDGRERSLNVIDTPHDQKEILKVIRKVLFDKRFISRIKKCRNLYGDGLASRRIVKILNTIKLDQKLLAKKITY